MPKALGKLLKAPGKLINTKYLSKSLKKDPKTETGNQMEHPTQTADTTTQTPNKPSNDVKANTGDITHFETPKGTVIIIKALDKFSITKASNAGSKAFYLKTKA